MTVISFISSIYFQKISIELDDFGNKLVIILINAVFHAQLAPKNPKHLQFLIQRKTLFTDGIGFHAVLMNCFNNEYSWMKCLILIFDISVRIEFHINLVHLE